MKIFLFKIIFSFYAYDIYEKLRISGIYEMKALL